MPKELLLFVWQELHVFTKQPYSNCKGDKNWALNFIKNLMPVA
jgi:hypothetical protein